MMVKKIAFFVFTMALGCSYAMAEPDCRATCQEEANVCYATHPINPYVVKYCTMIYQNCMDRCEGI